MSRRAEGDTSLADDVLPLDGILIQSPSHGALLIALHGAAPHPNVRLVAGRDSKDVQAARSDGELRGRILFRPPVAEAGPRRAGIALNLALVAVTLASVLLMLRNRARHLRTFLPPEPDTATRIGYLNLGKR